MKMVWLMGWGWGQAQGMGLPHHRGYHTEQFQPLGSLSNVQTCFWLGDCYWHLVNEGQG